MKHPFYCTKIRAFLAGILLSGLCMPPAYAVHDQELELEGNVANDGAAVPGNYDWVNLFDVSGGVATPKTAASVPPLPAGFYTPTFIRDFNLKPNGDFDNSDDSTFTTGSKDTLNIGPYPDGSGGTVSAGWQCTKANNVLNQSDLINVYATAYEDPVTGEVKIYFAAERNGNNGTKNIAVWFLQDPTVGCSSPGGATDFTGNHVDGDLLIVSEFSNGGTVSSINVYEWVGGADGALNPTAVATGADCKQLYSTPGDVTTTPTADDVCATVNGVNTPGTNMGVFTPPWLTQTQQPGNEQSTDVQEFEFFEGGLSLTNLGLAGCFNRVLFNTRSSDELGADIKDYAVGSFSLCGLGVNKVCSDPTVVGPNPVIDTTDYASFLTKFDIVISKTGPGTLYDPTLEETATFATGDSCQIINISGCGGGAPATPIAMFENGNPVQVCDTVGATPVTVRIQCDTTANGFLNSVTAKAASSDGGTRDFSVSDTMLQAEACTAQVNPALRVDKICHDLAANHDLTAPDNQASHPANPAAVSLQYNGSFSGFGVDVFVELENTGNIKLDNISLSDSPVISFTPVTISQGTNTHTTTTFDGSLLPGQKAYFMGSYTASGPDSNQTDPCLASFMDTVTVDAFDATSGTLLLPKPMDTATCPLCVCP